MFYWRIADVPEWDAQQTDNGCLLITRFNKSGERRWWIRDTQRDDSLRHCERKNCTLNVRELKLCYRTDLRLTSLFFLSFFSFSIVPENTDHFWPVWSVERKSEIEQWMAIDWQFVKLRFVNEDEQLNTSVSSISCVHDSRNSLCTWQ